MTLTIKNEETFIIDANVRNSYMNRVDALEKVKGLLLLPNLEMATTRQVAEFYGVHVQTISTVVNDNREELQGDGYVSMSAGDIKKSVLRDTHKTVVKNGAGRYTITHDGKTYDMPYSKTNLFPRRATIRVGMLLRDSEIAKEVRTQLLNVEEKATKEVKVADINEEQTLHMAVGIVLSSGDLMAFKKSSNYRNGNQVK
ncbi:hypothetical protein [Bacillus cereus]|uniref:Uncharacterized protein n=1 Tax=Bacillus cereus MC67 TaxID=1053219 RepID=J8ENG3_BACCE|nr:hypothetical protein [Bacillus cereus]EJQ98546.1 hypothetical protein II3_03460 [Bacillus cereus MC67]EOP00134.1 hypothetical protein II1_05211 [Bacillus cereus MC118]